MHDEIGRRALRDEDGRVSISAAAAGERGVFVGVAGVDGHDGEEAQGFVVAVAEILAVFELGEGDVRGVVVGAEVRDDDVAQLFVARRVSGEVVEDWAVGSVV